MKSSLIKIISFASLLVVGMSANAGLVQLNTEAEMSGSITTLDFDGGIINGAGMAFEAGSFITSTGTSTMHSGSYGLAEASPFSSGPDNLATFTSGVYQVGLYFGNDDLCCTGAFTATLFAYDVFDTLIGSVSVLANMNDSADQFLGLQTDTLIFKTMLDYGTANSALWGLVDDFSYGGDMLAVPEPMSLALFGLGLAGLGLGRRRKNSEV